MKTTKQSQGNHVVLGLPTKKRGTHLGEAAKQNYTIVRAASPFGPGKGTMKRLVVTSARQTDFPGGLCGRQVPCLCCSEGENGDSHKSTGLEERLALASGTEPQQHAGQAGSLHLGRPRKGGDVHGFNKTALKRAGVLNEWFVTTRMSRSSCLNIALRHDKCPLTV